MIILHNVGIIETVYGVMFLLHKMSRYCTPNAVKVHWHMQFCMANCFDIHSWFTFCNRWRPSWSKRLTCQILSCYVFAQESIALPDSQVANTELAWDRVFAFYFIVSYITNRNSVVWNWSLELVRLSWTHHNYSANGWLPWQLRTEYPLMRFNHKDFAYVCWSSFLQQLPLHCWLRHLLKSSTYLTHLYSPFLLVTHVS